MSRTNEKNYIFHKENFLKMVSKVNHHCLSIRIQIKKDNRRESQIQLLKKNVAKKIFKIGNEVLRIIPYKFSGISRKFLPKNP